MALPSYDQLDLRPEHVTHARQILDAAGGRTVKNLERILRDLHTYDHSVPRQVLAVLRQHLCIAMRHEEMERRKQWRPMR
jgi:hypothetical protein